MKKIRFTDDRQLLSGGLVLAGEEREFDDAEADGFVRSGVAIHVSAAAAKRAKTEGGEG